MPESLEERVAYLEGKVDEHSRGFGELRELVIHLDQKVDRFREELMRANSVTNQRIDALDQKVDRFRGELNQRIDALDQKISRHFTWLAGMLFAVLLAVIGALLGK